MTPERIPSTTIDYSSWSRHRILNAALLRRQERRLERLYLDVVDLTDVGRILLPGIEGHTVPRADRILEGDVPTAFPGVVAVLPRPRSCWISPSTLRTAILSRPSMATILNRIAGAMSIALGIKLATARQ